MHLEIQIQKPSLSDSGSFGLTQGLEPILLTRSKDTLGKLCSKCPQKKKFTYIEHRTAGIIPGLAEPVRA